MENSEVLEKGKVKNMINVLQRRTSILREKTITKNTNSVAHLVKKWTENSKDDSEQLRPELEGFEGLSVMNGDYIEKEPTEDKVLVIGDIVLNDNEKRVLTMNPKFAVYKEIDLEEVEKNLAVGGIKTRWDKQGNPELYEDPVRLGEELGVQVNVPSACEAEASARHPYNFDTNSIRLSSRRPTDYKSNTFVHLPKVKSIKLETQISIKSSRLLKVANETKEVIENTSDKGQNLDKGLRDGIKSLKKRSEEGEIVITETDKSGKLCVFSMEEYIAAGEVHTSKDKKIDEEDLKDIQKKT